ncbi:MAG: 2-C-methyl-D-erythritol 2,4-cyclodiphosphate synthase [Gammaproteobacteria bacterium]|nr:2-C-methyl-D-erythritol 2,4-cyclodiphosphate synthase [Gammaproteobacteria bacterium]
MRVGTGIDIHAFGPGDSVALGGRRIPHSRGVLAHSDGDVVLHALVDALLGAAGLGDIGQHFPDSDPQWQGAESRRFVQATMVLLERQGWQVVNADITVLAQLPKIAPWREQIRGCIAGLLGVDPECINLKATTPEFLGFVGRNEGLAALATVLIDRRA